MALYHALFCCVNRHGRNVVTSLVANWSKLSSWWSDSRTTDTKRLVVSLLKKAILLDKKVIIYRFHWLALKKMTCVVV